MYLSRQLYEEAVHVQFYLTLLDTYIPEHKEREAAFAAVENIPSIRKKAEFCMRWIDTIQDLDSRDRYVVEEMRRSGYNIGGEQSGHVIFLDHNTTGDGLLTALQVLAVLRRKELPLSELARGIERFPQVLLNVAVSEQRPIDSLPEMVRRIRQVEDELAGRGRVLIRYSGTEKKARVMVEGEDEGRVRAYADDLAATLRRALAGAE
jgi:phosphoglucosamine mutase